MGAATLVVAALVAAGCSSDGDTAEPGTDDPGSQRSAPSAEPVEVRIDTFIFEPDPVTVDAGTPVRFTNDDPTEHTVTAGTREVPGDEFDRTLAEGEQTEIVLDEPGTYEYFCALHDGEGMTGTVVVR